MKYLTPALVLLLLVLSGWFFLRDEPPPVVSVGWYERPPLITRDPLNGLPRGFHFDVLNEIAKRKNLKIDYIETTRDEFIDKPLGAERFMMAMPIVISEGRKKSIDFSWPVSEFKREFVGRAELFNSDGGIDLSTKKIGNLQGTYRMTILEEWLKNNWIGDLVTFETSQEVVDSLLTGRVDFIYDESEFIEAIMMQYPGLFRIVEDEKFALPPGYKAFPLRKGQAGLLNLINGAMREIMEDGTYSTLYRHYFVKGQPQEPAQGPAPGYDKERLPGIEINESKNARAILNDFFNVISSDSDTSLVEERSGLVDQFLLEGRHEFLDKLQRARIRLNELLLLIKGQPKDVPYFAAFYYRQIHDLRNSFERMRASIEAYRHKFEMENNQIMNNIQMIKQLDIPDPDLQWRKRWVETNYDSVVATQAQWIGQIDETLKETVEFQAQLEEIMHFAEQDSLENYRNFYFYRFGFLGNTSGLGGIRYQWLEILSSLNSWFLNLPTQIQVNIPDIGWWLTLARVLLASTLLALAFAYWIQRHNPRLLRRYLVPFSSAGLGIFFAISAQILPMIFHNLFSSLSLFAFTLAIMVSVWKLRKVTDQTIEINPFVVTIPSLMAIDLMLVLLTPHLVVLAGLVILTLVNLLWLGFCYARLRKYQRREIDILLTISSLTWLAAGIRAWMGYLYPAMYIAVGGQLLFMVGYAGLILTRLLLTQARALDSPHPLLASFLSSLLMPLTWFILLLGAISWMVNIFNADWLFLELYNIDIFTDNPVDLSLSILVNLLLAGLFINFLLHWIGRLLVLLCNNHQLDLVSVNSSYLVIRYLVWFLFVVACLASLNIAWENLKWIVGGLSVGFGFALKDVLENFFAGIIVLIGKQVRPGDTIEFGSVYGKIEKINIRATFVKTEDNALIAVPNSQIVSKEFRNWTLNGDKRRQEIELVIAGQSDVHAVKQIMLEAMAGCDILLKEPPPDVLFMKYKENDILLRARFWIHVPLRTKSISIVLEAMDQAFKARGVVVAVPGFDIRLDSASPLPHPPLALSPPRMALGGASTASPST